MRLSQKLVNTIPQRAYAEVGNAIGIRRNGVLILDSPYMKSVIADCCLYDWFERGKNLVQRYADLRPPNPETDEGYLLSAYLQAEYRILDVQSAAPGAGLRCQDVLSGEELFLMDVALSQNSGIQNAMFATRTISLGEYWMTGGAALPVTERTVLWGLSHIDRGRHKLLQRPEGLVLSIVRACLATGAADHVAYQNIEEQSSELRPRSLVLT